ncbi:Zinc finger 813-like protein [Daphnia magna]|uniref:Zinc finger 813-like protein n=1 Tax=Daphnia magna TaxID=35525 RepID=A0A164XU30_9CRUS|nr:Zinc finger 813-like protein [Daphnia magna]
MAASVACPLCLHSSFSQVNLFVTAFLNFFERPLNCPLCDHLAGNATALKEHLNEHLTLQHPNAVKTPIDQLDIKKYACKQCANFETNDIAALRLHVESEHPERKFLCVVCCKLFKAQASLTLHLRMAHQTGNAVDRKHQCQFCRKKFISLGRKQAHEKLHQTDLSAGSVRSPIELKTVDSTAHSPAEPEESKTLFVCPICDKSFKKEQYLQQHSRTHEAKKWECSVCRKLFTTKEYLRKHARLHTGETPYTCDQCGKTFTFQQSYHKHLLYHSDDRPYPCDQCNRRFKELSTLHNHQRIHTGEKPYSCDICGLHHTNTFCKAFRQRVSYVVHRRIHTGALPYVCLTCGKSFRYKVSQRTHKCDAGRGEEGNDIIRHRPDWLERLVTAQQQLSAPEEKCVAEVGELEITPDKPPDLDAMEEASSP